MVYLRIRKYIAHWLGMHLSTYTRNCARPYASEIHFGRYSLCRVCSHCNFEAMAYSHEMQFQIEFAANERKVKSASTIKYARFQ